MSTTETSSQPKLPEYLQAKIKKGWAQKQQLEPTNRAIRHLAQFIPLLKSAEMASKPLFGDQQIPGQDATLVAHGVSLKAVILREWKW